MEELGVELEPVDIGSALFFKKTTATFYPQSQFQKNFTRNSNALIEYCDSMLSYVRLHL
jgi:hypothetical protein